MDYKEAYVKAQAQVRELRDEVATLKDAQNDNLPSAYWRMQGKIDRQRRELDRLNRRVTSQRMRLRKLVELGRDLTKEEYDTAKAELLPSTQERIDEYTTV